MKKVGIVIPTRNRRSELLNLLHCINDQNFTICEVIIVDSSDQDVVLPGIFSSDIKVTHIRTKIRSAAEQRNIGKRLLDGKMDYLAFLDDDVLIDADYIARLVCIIDTTNAVGVSGVAINRSTTKKRTKPSGLAGLVHRIFLLDSKSDGVVLNSGINIPIRSEEDINFKVDWLIGCSMWRNSAITSIEFERDFEGQSLAEDVIFSVRARAFGNLITNPSVIIDHRESPIERPDTSAHYNMWVVNRRRLIQVMGGGLARKTAFHLANLGQIVILVFLGIRKDPKYFAAAKQIVRLSMSREI